MVVFIDHEDDNEHTPGALDPDLNRVLKARNAESLLRMHALPGRDGTTDSSRPTTTSSARNEGLLDSNSSKNENETDTEDQNLNLNVDHGFSAALSCYPIVKSLSRSVDLNTLHALSRTCRQFRTNLLQFRNQIVRETLKCCNEGENRAGMFRCARDMVGECQRCGRCVCRNCTMKSPSISILKNRLRRLCSTCLSAPLAYHLSSHPPDPDSLKTNTPPDPSSPNLEPLNLPCTCETYVWLCKPCGQILRSEDTAYKRVWTWRTRYSAYLGGGLGTGIGDGSQGVMCGRGETCLAAEDTEVEVVCEVDEWECHNYHEGHGHGEQGIHFEGRDDEEPGYLRQEIEGIGGVLKQKVKKWVRVGASVEEFDGERETGRYLEKETSGEIRSWCPWCWRVVPSKGEAEAGM